MFYRVLTLAAIALTVVKADNGIPACATNCFISAIEASGCSLSDPYCQCTTGSEAIQNSVTPCLIKSTCTTGEVDGINSAVASICTAAIKAGPLAGSNDTAVTSSTTTSAAAAATSSHASDANLVRAGTAFVGLSLAAILAL